MHITGTCDILNHDWNMRVTVTTQDQSTFVVTVNPIRKNEAFIVPEPRTFSELGAALAFACVGAGVDLT